MRFNLILSLTGAIALIIATALTTSSSAIDPESMQDDVAVPAGELAGSNTIGQTFVFHYPRLHAIQVRWVVSSDLEFSRAGRITLHLRRRVDDAADIATASIALSEAQNNALTKFVFAPIRDSQDQSFYFFVDASQAEIQPGPLSLWASGEDNYPDGRMYFNGVPSNLDLAFRAFYEPEPMMLSRALVNMLLQDGSTVLIALCILIVPGLVLFLSRESSNAYAIETIAQAGGLGLAVLSGGAILWFWVSPADRLTMLAAAISLLLFLFGRFFLLRTRRMAQAPTVPGIQPRNIFLGALAMLALLSIGVGLLQVRDVQAPLWVDSIAHAGYIKRTIDTGHLPADNFYHLGYHAVVAILVQLAGISIPQAMLVVGQLLITQIGLSIFLLSQRLTGSALAGLASAVCVWFLSPTPSYLITWGRYPLLMGAAILPLALLYAIDLIEKARLDRRSLFFAGVTFIGLMFSQIRLTAFYILFLTIYLTYTFFRNHSPERDKWQMFVPFAIVIGAGFLFGAIWFGTLYAHGIGFAAILAENATAPSIDLSTAIAVLLLHHGPEIGVLAGLALIIGLVQQSKTALISLGWYISLYLIAEMPGSQAGGGILSPSLVLLMGFLPAALVIGDSANYLYFKLVFKTHSTSVAIQTAVWATAISLVGLIGAIDMASIANPATILFSRADERAIAWIKQHHPTGSKFLVNSFLWSGAAYIPSDGGGWIPYFTDASIEYWDSSLALESYTLEDVVHWIDAQNINYIYLGRRAGVWRKADFECQPNRYALIYNQGGVEIYRVLRPDARSIIAPVSLTDCAARDFNLP